MENLPDWLIAIIAIVYPAIQGPPEDVFNGYVEVDYVYLAPAQAGRIATISVDEGQRIAAGDKIFTLDDSSQQAALKAAEARVHVAEANLENLQTGSRDQEIAVIRAELARAEAERDLAASNLSRSEQLLERGNVSQAQVDSDRATLASATAQVAELKAKLEVAELPARDAQRIAAEASLDAAEAEAAAARTALDDRTVFAPVSGRIDSKYFEEGEVAGAGVPVFSVLPDGDLRAVFFIPEPERAVLSIGDVLAVSCDGCADGITATVTKLASEPQYTPPIIYSRDERRRLVFRAEADISADSELLPGQPITLKDAP